MIVCSAVSLRFGFIKSPTTILLLISKDADSQHNMIYDLAVSRAITRQMLAYGLYYQMSKPRDRGCDSRRDIRRDQECVLYLSWSVRW